MTIPISEKDLQRGVNDYLQIGMNQGRWWYSRLNSGMAYKKHGDKYYAIKLCEKGTTDFLVIRKDVIPAYPTHIAVEAPQVIFLELKSTKGKQTQEQREFQERVEMQECGYHIIRSIDELIKVLGED